MLIIGQYQAVKFATKHNLDYTIACWAIPSSLFSWCIKLRTGIPYAAWSLGSDVNKYIKIPILRQLIYQSFSQADKLFANSYALIEKTEKFTKKTCDFLPAITNFETPNTRSKTPKGPFHFLYVGRLEKVKGPDVLVDAGLLLGTHTDKFVIDVLGDGTMRYELEQKVKDNGHIIFHGWADERMVSKFMAESDCLIIPSRNESMPLVMIEAAKRQLPVVATDVGDCKRVIRKNIKLVFALKKKIPLLCHRQCY